MELMQKRWKFKNFFTFYIIKIQKLFIRMNNKHFFGIFFDDSDTCYLLIFL